MYAYVDQPVERLCNGGRFLLWAMRGWAHAVSRGTCPPVALSRGFAGMGVLAALPDFNAAMALLNRHARERLALAPMGCTTIGEDEAVMMGIWRHLSLGDADHVRATLALIACDEAVLPVSRAMTAVVARIVAAGFDLSDLSSEILKEVK